MVVAGSSIGAVVCTGGEEGDPANGHSEWSAPPNSRLCQSYLGAVARGLHYFCLGRQRAPSAIERGLSLLEHTLRLFVHQAMLLQLWQLLALAGQFAVQQQVSAVLSA